MLLIWNRGTEQSHLYIQQFTVLLLYIEEGEGNFYKCNLSSKFCMNDMIWTCRRNVYWKFRKMYWRSFVKVSWLSVKRRSWWNRRTTATRRKKVHVLRAVQLSTTKSFLLCLTFKFNENVRINFGRKKRCNSKSFSLLYMGKILFFFKIVNLYR